MKGENKTSVWRSLAEGRNCIVIRTVNGKVAYIPQAIAAPFQMLTMEKEAFEARHKYLDSFPVREMAKLFAAFAKDCGANAEVAPVLEKLAGLKKGSIKLAGGKS